MLLLRTNVGRLLVGRKVHVRPQTYFTFLKMCVTKILYFFQSSRLDTWLHHKEFRAVPTFE